MFYLLLTQIAYYIENFFSPPSTPQEKLKNIYLWGKNQAKKGRWLAALNFLLQAEVLEKKLDIFNPERAIYQALTTAKAELVEKENESLQNALKSKCPTTPFEDERIKDIFIITNKSILTNIEKILQEKNIQIKAEKTKHNSLNAAKIAEEKNQSLRAAFHYSQALLQDPLDPTLYLKRHFALMLSQHSNTNLGFDETIFIWLTSNEKTSKKVIDKLKKRYKENKTIFNAMMLMQFYVGYVRWFTSIGKKDFFIEIFRDEGLELHREITEILKTDLESSFYYNKYTKENVPHLRYPLFSEEIETELREYFPSQAEEKEKEKVIIAFDKAAMRLLPPAEQKKLIQIFSQSKVAVTETKSMFAPESKTQKSKKDEQSKLAPESKTQESKKDEQPQVPVLALSASVSSEVTNNKDFPATASIASPQDVTETHPNKVKKLKGDTNKNKRNPFSRRNNNVKPSKKKTSHSEIHEIHIDEIKSDLPPLKPKLKLLNAENPATEPLSPPCKRKKEILDEGLRQRQQIILQEYQADKLAKLKELEERKKTQLKLVDEKEIEKQKRKKMKKLKKVATQEAKIFTLKLFDTVIKNFDKKFTPDATPKTAPDLGPTVKYLPVPDHLISDFENIYKWQEILGTPLLVYGGLLRDLIQGNPSSDIDLMTTGDFKELQKVISLASDSKLYLAPMTLNDDKSIKDTGKVTGKLTTRFFEPLKTTISILQNPLLKETNGVKKVAQTLDFYNNSLFAKVIKFENRLYLEFHDPFNIAIRHCNDNIVKLIQKNKLQKEPILLLRTIIALARNKKRSLTNINNNNFETHFLYYKKILQNLFALNPDYFGANLAITPKHLAAFISDKIIHNEYYELIKAVIEELEIRKFLPDLIFNPPIIKSPSQEASLPVSSNTASSVTKKYNFHTY